MFKKRFEPFMGADDGITTVANGADSPTADGEGTPDNETNPEGQEGAVEDETEIPHQDVTTTQAFATRMREARTADLRRIEELEAIANEKRAYEQQIGRIQGVLNEIGYDGSVEEIADRLEAERRQTSPEQVRAERESQQKAIQEAIHNSPEFIQAQQMLAAQTQLANKAMFDSQLVKITQIDPSIKSLEDLSKIPDNDVFEGLLATGKYTIDTAYKRLMEIRGTKPQQVDTKGHLQIVGGSDSGAYEEVPSDIMKQYRVFMPKATDKEIREHYRKSHGGK